MVQQTSRDAYRQLDLSRQQRLIYGAFIILGESCIADVAANLEWEKSTVSPRMNELVKKGWLIETEKRASRRTGVSGMHFRAVNRGELF